MKKILVLFTAILVLAGCSSNGKTLESVATVGPNEEGITEISSVKVTSSSNKLTHYKSEVEYQYPAGGAGMGDQMKVIRSAQDELKDIKAVTIAYSIDGDNIKVNFEISLKDVTEEELATINKHVPVAFQADADAFFDAYQTAAEANGATVTVK